MMEFKTIKELEAKTTENTNLWDYYSGQLKALKDVKELIDETNENVITLGEFIEELKARING